MEKSADGKELGISSGPPRGRGTEETHPVRKEGPSGERCEETREVRSQPDPMNENNKNN